MTGICDHSNVRLKQRRHEIQIVQVIKLKKVDLNLKKKFLNYLEHSTI